MKKLAFVLASTTALVSAPALAADLSRPIYKAPVVVAAPAYTNWNGFYIGAHVGGAFGHLHGRDIDGYAAGAPVLPNPFDQDLGGVFGGGQIGYNVQFGQFVLGLEADGGWMGIHHNELLPFTASGTRVGIRSSGYVDVTGRAGVAFGSTLLYAKGGGAWFFGREHFSTVTGSFSSITDTPTFSGWTVGAGAEWMFAPNWSAKLEYQYFDFGRQNFTVFNAAAVPFRFDERFDIHTVKVGVNYHFNWVGPVMASY